MSLRIKVPSGTLIDLIPSVEGFELVVAGTAAQFNKPRLAGGASAPAANF
jgi:hypothetical protein